MASDILDSSFQEFVLDTNVVLDWLAFGHPIGAVLSEAMTTGRWRWIATKAMRDELSHVIVRASLARWAIQPARIWSAWDTHVVPHEAPTVLGAHERLICTDADDQKFIDLAIARRVGALLTRDRAVLRLAPRARRLGVLIATPERWVSTSMAASG